MIVRSETHSEMHNNSCAAFGFMNSSESWQSSTDHIKRQEKAFMIFLKIVYRYKKKSDFHSRVKLFYQHNLHRLRVFSRSGWLLDSFVCLASSHHRAWEAGLAPSERAQALTLLRSEVQRWVELRWCVHTLTAHTHTVCKPQSSRTKSQSDSRSLEVMTPICVLRCV